MISIIFRQCACAKYSTGYQERYIANERYQNRMSFIIFPSILVYNCNDNTVFLVSCVHDFFLSHDETGKMHQLDLINHTYTTCTMLYVRSVCLI